MTDVLTSDRRACPSGDELTPAELLRINVQNAQRQLAEARESLISARRRVSALEKAVESWLHMAHLVADNDQCVSNHRSS